MEESNVLVAMRKGYPCIILCDEKLGDRVDKRTLSHIFDEVHKQFIVW